MGYRSGFIYFLKPTGMDGPIKIGCSTVPENRLRSLMAWSPVALEIMATVPDGDAQLEHNIHDCFMDCHSHSEWFHAVPRLLETIAKLRAGVSLSEAIDLADRRGSISKKMKSRTRSPHAKARVSWNLRLLWAIRKQEKATCERWFAPEDVYS